MKKRRFFFSFLVSSLAIWCLSSAARADNSIVGMVQSHDSAEMSLDGTVWSSIDKTMPVTTGTIFKASKGKLFFTFHDNVRVRLEKTSELAIKKDSQNNYILELTKGELLYTVPPSHRLTIITFDTIIKIKKDDPLRPEQKNTVGSIFIKNSRTYVKRITGNVNITYLKNEEVLSDVSHKNVPSSHLENTNKELIAPMSDFDDNPSRYQSLDRAIADDKIDDRNNGSDGTSSTGLADLDNTAGSNDKGEIEDDGGPSPFTF